MLPLRKNLTFANLFNLSATLKTQSSVTSFIASFHLTTHWNPLQLENSVPPYNKWDSKRKMQSITCLDAKNPERMCFGFRFNCCVWMTLSCVALCRWVQPTYGQEDIQLFVSNQRIWITQSRTLWISVSSSEKAAPEGSQPRWTGQLWLWSAFLCIRILFFLDAFTLCRKSDDWSACVFCAFRMRLLDANQRAAPAWRHLWWMTLPQNLCWGRKVSQEAFRRPLPP